MRFRIRPRIGRRTRLNIGSGGSFGLSHRRGRTSGWFGSSGAGLGGRSRSGLFDWIFRR